MSNDINCRRCGREVSEKSIEDGSHECDESALLERIEELEARTESSSRMQAGTLAIFYATAASSVMAQGGAADVVNSLMTKCVDVAPASLAPWIPVNVGDAISQVTLLIVRVVDEIVKETE